MYKSIHIIPLFQLYSHSHNYHSRVIQMTRLQTTRGSASSQLLVSTYPFESTLYLFLYTRLVVSLPVIFPYSSSQKCFNSKSSNHIIPPFKNHQSHSNNPHPLRNTRNEQVKYHSRDEQGKDILIRYLIVAHQTRTVKFSHRTLEFSQSN